MRKITQDDIAKQLNLSRVTVSKVLLNKPGVSEGTRRLVLETAKQMKYDLKNESIQRNRSAYPKREIALLFRGVLSNSFFWSIMIQEISNLSGLFGLNLRLYFITEDMVHRTEVPHDLIDATIDGIILIGGYPAEYHRYIASMGIPTVSEDIPVELLNDPVCDVVNIESMASSAALTRHLIEKGHRRIAFVGDPMSCSSFYLRFEGYRSSMLDAGLPCLYDDLFQFPTKHSQYDVEHLKANLRQAKGELPTAYVCANDAIAGSIFYIERTHPELIGKVDLTGFDHDQRFITTMPDISTVDVFIEEVAATMVDQIVWRCENPTRPFQSIYTVSKPLIRD